MKYIVLAFPLLLFFGCISDQNRPLTEEEMVGKSPEIESQCSSENHGTLERLVPPAKVIEFLIDKAKNHCSSNGDVDFERSKFNALENLEPDGSRVIVWSESVICNC